MIKHFFITGLVRCRSAWLANLLTWGPTFCWHDVFYGLKSDDEFHAKMSRYTFVPEFINAVGVSDPALVHCWRTIHADYPDAKWVVIHRNLEDAFRSAHLAFEAVSRESLVQAERDLGVLCETVKPRFFEFEDLANVDKCYELATHLNVVIGPRARVQQLCEMNVQIHPPVLKRRLESLKRQPVVDTKEAA